MAHVEVTNPGSKVEHLVCSGCKKSVDLTKTDPKRYRWVVKHVKKCKTAEEKAA
jgi:hypothetical protein